MNGRSYSVERTYSVVRMAVAGLLLGGCSVHEPHAALFPSPAAAVNALEDAVVSRSAEKTSKLLGPEGEYLLYTGDAALDKERATRFVQAFNEQHDLKARDGSFVLVLGKKEWPFPVPLVKSDKGWFFDAEAGRDEILARRIGENELSTLEVARGVALAQRVYAARDWDNDGAREYAVRLISAPGTKDGLFWPTAEGEVPSPLGPLVAKAADENYVISPDGEPQPYRGYCHRLLTRPPNPADAADPLTAPGHYWLISYPAMWGESGVMTFATNERGWIYEKSLGPDHDYSGDELISIDESWTRIE